MLPLSFSFLFFSFLFFPNTRTSGILHTTSHIKLNMSSFTNTLGVTALGACYAYFLYKKSEKIGTSVPLKPITVVIVASSQPQPRGNDAAPPIALSLLPSSQSTILDGW